MAGYICAMNVPAICLIDSVAILWMWCKDTREGNYNNDARHFIIYQLMWIGIYTGIGLVLAILLPFPISFISAIVVFVVMNFYRRKILRKLGGDSRGLKSIFSWPFSSSSSGNDEYYRPLKYYCVSCGTENKGIACTNCGSKMKRVE